jgi:hypothetical protein
MPFDSQIVPFYERGVRVLREKSIKPEVGNFSLPVNILVDGSRNKLINVLNSKANCIYLT